MWCDVMWCNVIWYVIWTDDDVISSDDDVMSCDNDVMWCNAMRCDRMWCDRISWSDVKWSNEMWCDLIRYDVSSIKITHFYLFFSMWRQAYCKLCSICSCRILHQHNIHSINECQLYKNMWILLLSCLSSNFNINWSRPCLNLDSLKMWKKLPVLPVYSV